MFETTSCVLGKRCEKMPKGPQNTGVSCDTRGFSYGTRRPPSPVESGWFRGETSHTCSQTQISSIGSSELRGAARGLLGAADDRGDWGADGEPDRQ